MANTLQRILTPKPGVFIGQAGKKKVLGHSNTKTVSTTLLNQQKSK